MTRLTTEDWVLDHGAIEASNVIERYLQGKLPADEVEVFEDHFLDCEECLEKLELSRMLYQGMQEVAAEEVTKSWAATSLIGWLARRGRVFQGTLAMGLLALAFLPAAFMLPELSRIRGDHQRLTEEMTRALAPRAQGSNVLLSQERSAADDEPSVRIRVDAQPQWIGLALELPPAHTAGSFEVRLLQSEDTLLWQSDPILANPPGQLTLSVHSSWLDTAIYHLEVLAADAAQDAAPLARFSFQASRQNASPRSP